MRIRILTLTFLALASTATLALQPLEPQSAADWPPKAVRKAPTGKVPDFSDKNERCLNCHKSILKVKTARKNIPNLHQLHLNSKKVAYEGKNRDCLSCHEMVTPAEPDPDPDVQAQQKEGWFVKGWVYHPNWQQRPRDLWTKLIVRGGEGTGYSSIDTLRSMEPDIFKTSLKRLVCNECHGPDSKIKTFYGAPQAANVRR